ncbi:MAG: hypothetical protein M8861_13370 [marine benthic group bacterium]|nr:hypothetical protein [Gemmatimonadota bacterium]
MKPEEQEADLTLWANGVAEALDEKERPELAAVFRAFARRDAEAVREAVGVFSPAMLDALDEMVELERLDRAEAGQDRSAELLEWLVRLVGQARDAHLMIDVEPGEDAPVQ